jgi:hypothetical protein
MRAILLVLAVCVTGLPAQAQPGGAALRTSYGAPSLEGVWSTLTATPLERPAGFDGLTTTEERAAAFAVASSDAFTSDDSDGVGARQSEWWEFGGGMTRINGEIRTSLIVDPPDGKMPYSDAGRAKLRQMQGTVLSAFDDPEVRPAPERCLTGGSGGTGAPLFVPRYNANYQIVQTPDHVVISMEQNRDVRIIRIGARHQPDAMRRWMGDSIGRWEGDTLVVETKGFVPGDAFKPASPILVGHNATVTERFTRISEKEILYRFSVADAETFVRPWSAEMLFTATGEPMFEYACHEANLSMVNILLGGRAADGVKR